MPKLTARGAAMTVLVAGNRLPGFCACTSLPALVLNPSGALSNGLTMRCSQTECLTCVMVRPSADSRVQEAFAFTVVTRRLPPTCLITSADWLPYLTMAFLMTQGISSSCAVVCVRVQPARCQQPQIGSAQLTQYEGRVWAFTLEHTSCRHA